MNKNVSFVRQTHPGLLIMGNVGADLLPIGDKMSGASDAAQLSTTVDKIIFDGPTDFVDRFYNSRRRCVYNPKNRRIIFSIRTEPQFGIMRGHLAGPMPLKASSALCNQSSPRDHNLACRARAPGASSTEEIVDP